MSYSVSRFLDIVSVNLINGISSFIFKEIIAL